MNLHIEPATIANKDALLALAVLPEQSGYIESVAQCLNEADGLPLWRAVGLYDGLQPVGFAMYGLFPEEGDCGRVWLDRFLIDQNFQGKGYGSAFLHLLIQRLGEEYGKNELYLSLYQENQAALALYERHGFAFNGELDINGEQVMVKR